MTTNRNLFRDRYGVLHTTPSCEEFARHPLGDPNNDMPAYLTEGAHCADCED